MSIPNEFRAFVADGESVGEVRQFPSDLLGDGDVTIKVEWSGVNYKDGLASTPNGKVARISPLVPGIDLAGTVVESESADVFVGESFWYTDTTSASHITAD